MGAARIAAWALGAIGTAYVFDVYLRDRAAGAKARELALAAGKPMIVVGAGTETASFTGPKLHGKGIPGSVHCDAAAPREAPCLRPRPCRGAERELSRIADKVIISDHIFRWIQIGAGSKSALNGLRLR